MAKRRPMARRGVKPAASEGNVLVEAFAVNERMNQLVLEHLAAQAWRAKPPGPRGRTIAAIFAHVHNIRRKWIRLSAPGVKPPPVLDRARCTQGEAQAALAESAACCRAMLESALGGNGTLFRRDGWAKPWPAGPSMVAYMLTHEAHHRGQVCLLAHQLGYPLPGEAAYGMWMWEKLWKECGFTRPR